MKPAWFPDWSGDACVIVASGPSASEQPVYLAAGRAKVVTINNSWRLAPWADVLYASDASWWQSGAGDEFCGLKVSRSGYPGVQKVSLRQTGHDKWHDEMIFDEVGTIGSGCNGGFQALNLVVQFGAADIALVGFDMRVDRGSHWHGDHPRGLSNPDAALADKCRMHLDGAAPALIARGISVTNCSPVSALTEYPKQSLKDWLDARR